MERKRNRSSGSEAVPEDIQIEILLMMPLKTLLRFMCVSKRWASIIRGKQFRDLYLLRSITRPRVLLFTCQGSNTYMSIHSVYQEEEPLLSSGLRHMLSCLEFSYNISQSIQGLICLHHETKLVLYNPGTNKFLTLPEIRASREIALVSSFFGYDEATNVFKVLCMKNMVYDRPSQGAKEYQVLTVGSDVNLTVGSDVGSWRPIRCKHRHIPATQGLCKGGVLYYGAWSGRELKSLVMSFNIRSEEFTPIDLPEGINIHRNLKLVNYKGDIALVNGLCGRRVVHMLVRNRVSGEWWRNRVVIPSWNEIVGDMKFCFIGTIGTGELVFAPNVFFDRQIFVLYYDTVTQKLRRFKIEGVVGGGPHLHVGTFLDHVDSLFLM